MLGLELMGSLASLSLSVSRFVPVLELFHTLFWLSDIQRALRCPPLNPQLFLNDLSCPTLKKKNYKAARCVGGGWYYYGNVFFMRLYGRRCLVLVYFCLCNFCSGVNAPICCPDRNRTHTQTYQYVINVSLHLLKHTQRCGCIQLSNSTV